VQKDISERGAHNQRALVKVKIRTRPGEIVWIEDLVKLVEDQSSSEIYPLLKREDEKFVTERAYDNPKFVEDVLRDIVSSLRRESHIIWFEVSCESLESIHNHSVFAYQQEGK
jgi:GTP cyclohydrolase I